MLVVDKEGCFYSVVCQAEDTHKNAMENACYRNKGESGIYRLGVGLEAAKKAPKAAHVNGDGEAAQGGRSHDGQHGGNDHEGGNRQVGNPHVLYVSERWLLGKTSKHS